MNNGSPGLAKNLSIDLVIEILLLVYFCFGIYSAVMLNDYGLLVFHIMLVSGFGYVIYLSLTARG